MAVNINVPSQVKTYANLSAFPATGALKTIYIAEDTNKTYRWTGSVYTEISASAAMTWGAIGGTLSNQTDLQSALDAKVPTSRTLTINGVTQDLSANRTFTISTGITIGSTAIASGTVGRILFEGAGNVVQESGNLFWDNTNGTLETTTTADNLFGLRLKSTTGQLRVKPYLNPTYGVLMESKNIADSAYLPFTISGSRILLADGNVLINTTTDAGFRLDVNGTARVQGQLTLNNNVLITSGEKYIFFNTTSTFLAGVENPTVYFGYNFGTRAIHIGSLGSGNILFRSSGNVCLDQATSKLLIGTTTDAGFRLDVNGTARVQNTTTITKGASNYITFEPSANGTSPFLDMFFSGQVSTRISLGTTSSTRVFLFRDLGTALGMGIDCGAIFSNSNAILIGGAEQKVQIAGTTNNYLQFTQAGTANRGTIGYAAGQSYMQIRVNGATDLATGTFSTAFFSTGNVGINTTTDAGFRLDVNGTARVSGATTLAGTNTLSGTTNISGIFSNWACHYSSSATSKPLSFSAQSGGATPNNVAIQFGFNFRAAGGLYSQDIFQNILYDNTANNIVTGFEWFTHQKQIGDLASVLAMSLRGKTLSLGTNTPSESSLLQMDSTTQGFLPPRMTTTQKNAIATPAAGLVVYDTTLNKLCVYTTAWETVTSL